MKIKLSSLIEFEFINSCKMIQEDDDDEVLSRFLFFIDWYELQLMFDLLLIGYITQSMIT